ncbi:MAG: glycosyltransferase, partial [Nocardioides sp.]
LMTLVGGAGHLDPLLPVARALAGAGHEVAVAGSGGQVARVVADGFTALPTSEPRPPAQPSGERTPLEPVDRIAAEVEFAENFADRATRRHLGVVPGLLREWRPDVVVREETDFGTAMACELAGVPCATLLILSAGTLPRPDLVAPRLEAIRAEHGLPPDPALATLGRDLVLAPFAPSFRDPSAPLSATALPYRPRPMAPQADGSLVYVSLGTVFNLDSGDLFERLLAGLADVPAEVLVTIGRNLDPARFGPQPGHVRVEQYVAQEGVLPQVGLVVSHGGSGSLMGALEHGVPSVLTPLGADQPHNAQRAADLGVARVLDAAAATPAEIAAAVVATLADDAAHRRARSIKAEIDALPDVAVVVPRLEQLATH